MSNPPAFQLYAADFYMDTVSWPIEAVGIYTRFLFYQWVNGSVPKEEKEQSRIAGCSIEKLKKNEVFFLKKFSTNGDGNLKNLRLEETRKEQIEYREKQANSGKLGMASRWKDHIKKDNTVNNTVNNNLNNENITLQSSSLSSSSKKNINTFVPNDKKSNRSGPKLIFNFDINEWENINSKDVELWRKAYPAVNIESEMIQAGAWLVSNPQNKKSNYKRFLNNWFKRAQDKASKKERSYFDD